MENEIENNDSPNVEEPIDGVESDIEEVEALRKQNVKLFERAKKAEGFTKVDNEWVKKAKPEAKPVEASKSDSNLSGEDVLALVKVPNEEDRDFIVQEAKERGKTVKEIIDSENTQILLNSREEKRRTAEASNTGGGQGGGKVSPDKDILSKIENTEDMSDAEAKQGASLIVEQMKKDLNNN